MITENTNDLSMEDMMAQVDASMKRIHKGDIIKGRIISVSDNEIMVNIGYITDGIVSKNEVDEDVDLLEKFKEGQELLVYVLDINDGEGNVVLSKKRADKVKLWDDVEKIYSSFEEVMVTVSEVVKGGVVAKLNGLRAFIPASQISAHYVKDLNVFLGKNLKAKIIEFDKSKGKIVLSSKEIEKAELKKKRDEVLNSIEKGQKRSGVVKKIVKFGAFVDIGEGVEGLVHISDLSWKRVVSPEDVVSVGDTVEVYVLEFDKTKERLSLAIKDIFKEPWSEVENKFKVNDVVEGTVVKFTSFGAFVEVASGVEGLLHISEICEENIAKASDKLSIGDKVKVKILSFNIKDKKMSLSIKEAIEKPVEDYAKYLDKEEEVTLGDLFKDKLKDLI
ncbi:30S ribosomal protein S1 [Haloimpatiens sp. FM7315]|uniref:30S ribosomal protein S1 n=1 Tax=Haloimpatiens sp. FM7315 TaxID=3298609 RepID=UPI0035A28C3D